MIATSALAQEAPAGLLMAGSAALEFGSTFLDESNDDSEDETGDLN